MIEYLKAENSILKDELLKATGKKCIILNDSQRRRLAILGKKLGKRHIILVKADDTISLQIRIWPLRTAYVEDAVTGCQACH